MMFTLVLLYLLTIQCGTESANILVTFPIPVPSHNILGVELAKAIAGRGHNVTFITPFASMEKTENISEIVVEELLVDIKEQKDNVMKFNSTFVTLIKRLLQRGKISQSRATLENTNVQNLLNSNRTFDLVIIDLVMSEALVVLGYHFKAPVIAVSTIGTMEMVNMITWNPQPPAYVPSLFLPFSDEMTFLQRVLNTIVCTAFGLIASFIIYPSHAALIKEKFPHAPPFHDMLHNVSLTLVNSHFSIVETPRPYQPNMIPVGGFHVQPQTLTPELKHYLDGAEEGALLFSLGSNLKSTNLPPEKLDVILKTLSKFPQRFVWKFEDNTLNGPKNVKIMKWTPQRAVLEHPNVKGFITHGGLLSITEAVYYGVPFVGFPGFGDQHYNLVNAAKRGIGIKLDLNELTEENFEEAIRAILDNPSYKQNIERYSSILRSQPVQPMDLAMYWVEHVLKFKGAPHLQNAGARLKWYQAYLLDVIAFAIGIALVVTYINLIMAKKLFRCVKRNFCLSKKIKEN